MKKVTILLIMLILIPFVSSSQNIEGLEYISPFHDGISAIKKGSQWAFINTKGDIVIDFRDDLITTKTTHGTYPIFKNERCLITQKKEGIPYYGYIDKSGKTVVTPQFLNATNFSNNNAIALELVKVDLGKNRPLNKDVYRYKYFEVIIDTLGKTKKYLTEAVYIGLTSSNLVKPPVINSKFIESSSLIATKGKDKKYKIVKISI